MKQKHNANEVVLIKSSYGSYVAIAKEEVGNKDVIREARRIIMKNDIKYGKVLLKINKGN